MPAAGTRGAARRLLVHRRFGDAAHRVAGREEGSPAVAVAGNRRRADPANRLRVAHHRSGGGHATLLTSDVSGGVLTLATKPSASINPTRPITYRVTMKDLSGLSVSGSATVTAGQAKTTACWSKSVESVIITVDGTSDAQEVRISGSGDYRGSKLTSRTATVQITGSGNASIMVSDRLDVQVSGSGTLRIRATHKSPSRFLAPGRSSSSSALASAPTSWRRRGRPRARREVSRCGYSGLLTTLTEALLAVRGASRDVAGAG